MLDSKPLFDVEISRICNASCIFCPRKKLQTGGAGIMDALTMVAVSDWIPKGGSVIIAGLGEPMLNPNIVEFVSKLRRKDIAVSLITNGILLDDEPTDALYRAGINEIQVSLHTLDSEKYEKVVGRKTFDTVINNLENISEEKYSGLAIRLVSSIGLDGEEKNRFVEYAKRKGFVSQVRSTHSRGGLLYKTEVKKKGCGIFPSTTFIDYLGEIRPCSNNCIGLSLGSVFKESFEDIKSKKKLLIRNGLEDEVCKLCDDVNRWDSLGRGNIHHIDES